MNAEDGSPHDESGDNGSPNDNASTPSVSSSTDFSDRSGAVSSTFGQDIPGSSSGTSEQGKRQKTEQSSGFPGVAASPPKFVSLEEIMSTASGMKNMALAHEIAVDNNFKLKKVEPPENSIQKQVKETMHKLFWQILERELNETPSNYTQALVLLRDVKEVSDNCQFGHSIGLNVGSQPPGNGNQNGKQESTQHYGSQQLNNENRNAYQKQSGKLVLDIGNSFVST